MDLQNAKLSSGTELFLADVLEKAMEIWKAVGLDKLQKGKKLHFSQSSQQQQSKWSSGSLTGSSFRSSSSASSSSKASSSSSHRGKGKKF